MMDNYARTQELLSHATNSAGASNKQYEKTMESLEAKLNQLKNAWDTFTMDIAKSELIKGVVDLLTNLLTVVNNLTGAFGSFSGVAKLIVAFAGFKLIQPIMVGLTADVVNFAKTLEGTGEARKGFENGLKEGFANLRKTLFDEKTWFYEGEKAGAAVGQGTQKGLNEAQTVNAAEAAQEILGTTELAEGLDQVKKKTNEYKNALNQLNQVNKRNQFILNDANKEALNKMAELYTKNGKAIGELSDKQQIYFKYLRQAGIPAEQAFSLMLKETFENEKTGKEFTKKYTEKAKEMAEALEKGALAGKIKNQQEAEGIPIKKGDTAATNENTEAQKKNNQEIKLGLLTRAKYDAQLLFSSKSKRADAASSLASAGANEKLTSSLANMTFGLGSYIAVLVAILAVWKAVAEVVTSEEIAERERAKATIENTKAIKEEVDTLKNIEKSYQNALSTYEDTIESKREYREATLELARALGIEIKATDILNGDTQKINKEIISAEIQKREEVKKTLQARLAAQETLIKDAKENSELVGFYQQSNIGILSPLDSINSFLYNKQTYAEYQEQQKTAEEGREETLNLLKGNLAQDAILQAKQQSATDSGAKTYEEYLRFRKVLTENIIKMGASEEEVQKALSEIVSDTEYGYEITYEAQREFKQRVENFGNIDTSKLDDFLSMVQKAGDTSLLQNINLFEASESGLERAYENVKKLSENLEGLTLGDSFVDVVEELIGGTDLDSLTDELKNEFNNELSKSKGILIKIDGVYDDIVSAQEQWNQLLAKDPSKVQKTKYLLELSKRALERQKEETEKLREQEESRQKLLDKNKRSIEEASRQVISDSRGIPVEKEINLTSFKLPSIEKQIQEYQQKIEGYGSNTSAYKDLDKDFINNEILKLQSQNNYLSGFLYKYVGQYKDFSNDPEKWIKNIDDDLERFNEIIKDSSAGDLQEITNAMAQLGDLKQYLVKVDEYYKNEQELLGQLQNINYSTTYQDLKIEQLDLERAEIEKAVFSDTNLDSFFSFREEVKSGNISTELSDEVKNILSEVPALSAGFANALEEWEYFIVNLGGEKVNDFLNDISNVIVDKAIEVVQSSAQKDQRRLINAQEMIAAIEEEASGDTLEQVRSAMINSALIDFNIDDFSSVKDILLTLNSLTEDQIKDLNISGKEFKQLQKYANDYANSLKTVNTLSNQLSKSNYGIKNSAETIKAIDSSLDGLETTINTLSDLLATIGEDFTISAKDAKKFAEVFPEILQNATVASDGIIHLNQATVESFIQGKRDEVQTDVDAINNRISNAIEVLKAKKEINTREQQNFNDFVKNYANDDDNLKNYLIHNSDVLYEHIRNSGAQEVVDTYEFLRLDNSKWSQYLSDVDEMNKSFYSNIVTYKKLADQGIDINALDKNELSVEYGTGSGASTKYTYNDKKIDLDTYQLIKEALFNNGIDDKGKIKITTFQDVLDKLDKSNKDKDVIDEENWQDFVDKINKVFEEQGAGLDQQIATLEAARINLSSLGNFGKNLKSGSGTETEKDKFENTLDKLYNLLQQLETLEYQYNELLKKRNITGKEIYENLKAQIGNLQEQQKLQKQIVTGRQNEINQIFSNTAGLSNYASYNKETGEIQVNQTAINSIVDKEYGDKILAAISKIETAEKSRKDALNSLSEINDKITEIKEQGISKYIELENRTLEALKQSRQSVIDNLSEINSTINTANSRLMETIRDNINKIRQDRQNEKSEKELSNLQGQLAAMASRTDIDTDTSKEYLDLQKNLQEKTESYQDTMIDQKLASIENDNKKAQEQRENQIKILSRNLETDEKTGVLMAEVQKLITEGMDGQGRLLKTSDFISILKQKDSFDGLSAISKMQWLEELEKLVAEGYAGIGVKNQLENYGAKAGTKLTFSDGSGSVLNGIIAENGNVNVNKNGKTYTYKEVFRNEAGNYETFETYGESSQTSSTVSKQSSLGLSEKDYYGVALATISGAYGWGTGDERVRKYKEKGFNPQKVQSLINTLIYDNQALNGKYFGIKELSEFDYKKYFSGGLADYTGFAWLDGTKTNPEAVLNAAQTKAFINLIDNQKKIMENGSTTNIGGQTNVEVNVSVGQISSDYDVDSMVRRVKEDILEICNYRNDNTLNYLR